MIVSLDDNSVEVPSDSDSVPALPDRLGKLLLKRLRKSIQQDTSVVLPLNVAIDRHKVKDAFVRFFACSKDAVFVINDLELNDDFLIVLEKFRNFLDVDADEEHFDRAGFLDALPERCEAIEQLLETQMFASFIDDRVRYASDVDVLLFDDFVKREKGATTAFLSDTSQDHKEVLSFLVPVGFGLLTNVYWQKYTAIVPNCLSSSAKTLLLQPPPSPVSISADRKDSEKIQCPLSGT